MRVLLSESASLTARETLNVLARDGVRVDLLHGGGVTLTRFSRWRPRLLPAPPAGRDPLGYLAAVHAALASGFYDALLPTHEQAWLLAAGRHLLPPDAPLAVATPAAFARVQGKLAFAELLDELDVPQPRWWPADALPADRPFPLWVKASYGTAGRSVRRVTDRAQEAAAIAALAGGGPVMGQAPAPGGYGQVQALFDHGRLVAAHTSVQVGVGAGGSAAARCSVDHPVARRYAERVGSHLGWHGGLTLDYFHVDGRPQFIEANPRTVEPGNAAAAGVDLPALTIALSQGAPLPARVVTGRSGVRTRSLLALAVGAAENRGTRRAVLRVVARGAVPGIGLGREVLTPVRCDPLSGVPLAAVVALLLADPRRAAALAGGTVDRYSVGPEAVALVAR